MAKLSKRAAAIAQKPQAHRFTDAQVEHREQHIMSQIGG